MNGRQVGLLSLRVDALYCALVAVSLALLAMPLANELSVQPRVVFIAAALILGWAVLLGFDGSVAALRPRLVVVLGVNFVAAAFIAALAVSRPLDAVSVLLVVVAAEVVAFAVSQVIALRRLR